MFDIHVNCDSILCSDVFKQRAILSWHAIHDSFIITYMADIAATPNLWTTYKTMINPCKIITKNGFKGGLLLLIDFWIPNFPSMWIYRWECLSLLSFVVQEYSDPPLSRKTNLLAKQIICEGVRLGKNLQSGKNTTRLG